NGTWVEVGTILPSDGNGGDEFGVSVALANETAVFGAAGSKARGADSGAAYLFERQDGRWAQMTRLTPDDGAPGQMFGFAVAASRDTIVAATSGARPRSWCRVTQRQRCGLETRSPSAATGLWSGCS